ncbi:hypothetical protein GCK72_026232 [Caenorhabditis remanei]|uniref:Uncharacterized protein n=1 Tax=Caenorhabditis remanei TaxID=31234 RepID=A0A6A5G4N1_CAERE|nr:hypothetical protein GCK72_026232 [Caenorhabditis remanei]KAF1749763.1 hypothetical protein GCK72_026232 [Caenorhabditis remanei]
MTYLIHAANSEKWSCGLEAAGWTERVAEAVATYSEDKDHINGCCLKHDQDFREFKRWDYSAPSLDEIDSDFINCLGESEFKYTLYVVRPAFWAAARVHSFVMRFKVW